MPMAASRTHPHCGYLSHRAVRNSLAGWIGPEISLFWKLVVWMFQSLRDFLGLQYLDITERTLCLNIEDHFFNSWYKIAIIKIN